MENKLKSKKARTSMSNATKVICREEECIGKQSGIIMDDISERIATGSRIQDRWPLSLLLPI